MEHLGLNSDLSWPTGVRAGVGELGLDLGTSKERKEPKLSLPKTKPSVIEP